VELTGYFEKIDTDLKNKVESVCIVASTFSDQVDIDGRFPEEAVTEAKKHRLLSAVLSKEYNGLNCSLADLVYICEKFGSACGSFGLIYAMHQTQLLTLYFAHEESDYMQAFTSEMVENQLLIASATTEFGTGGDIGRSIAAPELDSTGKLTVEKKCPVLSYGTHADVILATLRADKNSSENNQIFALLKKEDFTFNPQSSWNSLGMRGTCSYGGTLNAHFKPDQVLKGNANQLISNYMSPLSHILWSSVWCGVASSAVSKASNYLKKDKTNTKFNHFGTGQLAKTYEKFCVLRSHILHHTLSYSNWLSANDMVNKPKVARRSMESLIAINGLKVSASELAQEICLECMSVCGIQGYMNEGDSSLSREIRDALSAPVMVNNERIMAFNAELISL